MDWLTILLAARAARCGICDPGQRHVSRGEQRHDEKKQGSAPTDTKQDAPPKTTSSSRWAFLARSRLALLGSLDCGEGSPALGRCGREKWVPKGEQGYKNLSTTKPSVLLTLMLISQHNNNDWTATTLNLPALVACSPQCPHPRLGRPSCRLPASPRTPRGPCPLQRSLPHCHVERRHKNLQQE